MCTPTQVCRSEPGVSNNLKDPRTRGNWHLSFLDFGRTYVGGVQKGNQLLATASRRKKLTSNRQLQFGELNNEKNLLQGRVCLHRCFGIPTEFAYVGSARRFLGDSLRRSR